MNIWSWLSGAICGLFAATTLYAGAITLLETGSKSAEPLISASNPVGESTYTAPSSLFIGRQGSSLFAEIEHVEPVMAKQRNRSLATQEASGMSSRAAQVIRDIIEQAESSRSGYDAVQHGARIKPPRLPT